MADNEMPVLLDMPVPDYVLRYRNFETLQSIADDYKVSREAVRLWLKKYGEPTRTVQQGNEARDGQVLDVRGAEIRDALLGTRSIQETADLTGLSSSFVGRALRVRVS